MSTTKTIHTGGILKLKSRDDDVQIDVPSGKKLTVRELGLTNALAVNMGGTGSTSASDARSALGLVLGTDVQPYNGDLASIAAETFQNNDFMQYNGTDFVRKTPANVLSAIGAQASNAKLSDIAGTSFTTDHLLKWDGSNIVGVASSSGLNFNAPLSESGGDVDFDDSAFAKLADANTFVSAQTMQSAVKYQNSGEDSFTNIKVVDVTVSSTTAQSLYTHAIVSGYHLYVEARVVARNSDGASSCHKLDAHLYNNEGSLVYNQDIVHSDIDYATSSGFHPMFDISGGDLRLRVKRGDSGPTRYHVHVTLSAVKSISA